jgi:YbbR domain-containing protein
MVNYKKIIAKITEKWPAKVLSVVIAIFLFAFHRISDLQERFFSVPLQLEILGDLVPGSAYPQNIRISMRGTNNIYHISENDVEAYLDLTKYSEPGFYKAMVQIRRKGSASESEILEITADPPEILLELDNRRSKTVALTPNFQGFLEQGYELVNYNLTPNRIVIDGPEKQLVSISELRTDVIDLGGRNADFTAQVRIINPNLLIKIRGEQTAEFSGLVKELIVIDNFENLPIKVTGLDNRFEAVLNPPEASVKIQGVQSKLDAATAEAITLSVNCAEIKEEGIYQLPLVVTTEKEIIVERLEPELVTVTIKAKD